MVGNPVGYVHAAPRDHGVENAAGADVLGIGGTTTMGVFGTGTNGVVGYEHATPRDLVFDDVGPDADRRPA